MDDGRYFLLKKAANMGHLMFRYPLASGSMIKRTSKKVKASKGEEKVLERDGKEEESHLEATTTTPW